MSQSNEDRLRAQYTEIAVLAGQLAHEIRNPLSTISLNMDLLGEDFRDAETPQGRRARERITRVQGECRRLQELLSDFLNFARAEPVRVEQCSLNALVEELLKFFGPKAHEASIEVVRLLDPHLPPVEIDREQIRSSLLNLLLNAQQAMPEGGRLAVRTRAVGYDRVALDLIDTGAGMDEETLAKVFEPFFSTKRGGSGLGLPTARKIIEAHGGSIEVQSEVGRGTQFTITLPAAEPEPKRIAFKP